MKKIIMTIGLFCAVCVSALAQNTITMKFTGRNQNNDWIPLSYVLVENQTQRWQELVYYPDTTLFMGNVGIDDYLQNEKVQLFQNVPNPFDGVTDFALQLDEDQRVLLEIYDVNGKMVAQYEHALPQGQHLFRATLTAPQTYLLSAKTENDRLHIKMVNKGNGGENSIAYLGEGGSIQYQLKSDSKDNAPYYFANGDWMKYVGYANLCGTEYVSTPVEKNQTQSETVNLVFTLPLATVTAENATNITTASARLKGNAIGQDCDVTERGFFYGTSANNLTTKVTASGVGDGDFQAEISSLLPGTRYYCKAYAKTITGMAYSNNIDFWTISSVPMLTTISVSNVLTTSATSGGNITADGGASVTARGVCWSTNQNPTISNSHTSDGSGTGSFTSSMTGLTPSTTYYIRAYATSSIGTAYGNQVSFTTLAPTVATITTTAVSSITSTSASSGGNITDAGGASVTARGVCWSTSQNPTVSNSHTTNGSGTGSFTSSMTGLTAGTTYYVRAYATNSVGTAYGNQVSFTTAIPFTCGTSTVTDYDGNTYNTVQIGQQCWMKQNLKTAHYSDGTNIPLGNATNYDVAFRYCPNNNSSNVSTYGYLYNWKAVMRNSSSSSSNPSGVQGICPTGWHVPSDAEWTQLENYVGSQSAYQCGGNSTKIAKALASTTGWSSSSNSCAVGNNPSLNNATGFSAVPAGYYGGGYNSFGDYAYFWSATQHNSGDAYRRGLSYDIAAVSRYNIDKTDGLSVRCLRDESGASDDNTEVVIGTGTSSNYNAPFNNYYKDSWNESIYPATSINQTGSITQVAWNCATSESYTCSTLKIYMGTTSRTSHSSNTDWQSDSNLQLVYDHSNVMIGSNTGWESFTLDAPFAYNGTDNLVVVVAKTAANYTNNLKYYYTSSSNACLYRQTDDNVSYAAHPGTNSGTLTEQRANIKLTFTAPQPCPGAATVTDYDGNTYNTVQIGQQCWMKQNLKTTHYSDGTSISLGSSTSTTTAYRYYPNNSSSNVSTYGYLYNWKAVMRNSSSSSANPSGVQGICPTGWHVPSDAEWTQLENYVGNQSAYQCGGNSTKIAKALASATGWNSSTTTCGVGNTPANNNATGFSAVPAGSYGGSYDSFGYFAFFWSATQNVSLYAFHRYLCYDDDGVGPSNRDKYYGFSVRCLRD